MTFRFRRLALVTFLLWEGLAPARFVACGRAEPADNSPGHRSAAMVQRLEQMVYRRPRRGAAFDRWYQSYAGAGRVDELVELAGRRAHGQPDDVAAQLVWGMVCQQAGKDREAEAAYQAAQQLAPKDYYPWLLQGSLLARHGRQQEAAEKLAQAIKRKPPPTDYLPMAKQLGQLYLRVGQPARAQAVWSEMVRRFPGDLPVLIELARLLGRQKQYDQAIAAWRQVQQDSADDPEQQWEAHVEIAQLHLDAGRFETAIELLDQALDQARPDSWKATDLRRRIETALAGQPDVEQRLGFWRRRLRRRPDDLDGMLQLARALSRAGRHDEAIRQLQQAVARAPGRKDLRQALIAQSIRAGRHAEAISQAESLAQQFPEDPDSWYRMGTLYCRFGPSDDPAASWGKALTAWKRMADVRPDDASLAFRVAEACRKSVPMTADAGDRPAQRAEITMPRDEGQRRLLATAEQYYREAIRRAPDVPEHYEHLGQLLHALGRDDEAIDTWARVVTRDSAAQWHQLAAVYARFGFRQQAIEAGTRSVEKDAGNLAWRDDLIEWLIASGSYEQAREQVRQLRARGRDPVWEEKAIGRRVEVAAASGRIDREIRDLRKVVAAPDADWRDCWTLALMLARGANPAAAELMMEKAVAIRGDDPRLVRTMATLARERGDAAGALVQTRRLLALDPRRRTTYLQQMVELQLSLDRLDRAKATAEQLVTLAPADARAHRLLADIQFRRKENAAGLAAMRRAIETAPDSLPLRRLQAQRLLQSGETTAAFEQYWQCLNLARTLDEKVSIVTAISDASAAPERRQQLIAKLRSLLREATDSKPMTICLAHALAENRQPRDALGLLTRLYSQNPRDTDVLRRIVRIASQAGDGDTAITYQEKWVAWDGRASNVRQLASLYTADGQRDKAVHLWQAWLQVVTDQNAVTSLVDRQLRAGEFDQASTLMDAALAKYSDDWRLAYRAAIAQLGLGHVDRAAAGFEKTLAFPRQTPLAPDARVQPPEPRRENGSVATARLAKHSVGGVHSRPVSPSILSRPEELKWLDAARDAYARYRAILQYAARTSTEKPPLAVQVDPAESLPAARRDSTVALLLLRRQKGQVADWLSHLQTDSSTDPSRVSMTATALLAASEFGEGPELPKLLTRMSLEDPMRHVIQLRMPVPLVAVGSTSEPSETDRWQQQMRGSYRWIGDHRPDLRQPLMLPLSVNLILLGDGQFACQLVDQAIRQSRGLGDLERILPLVALQASAATRRAYFQRVAACLRDATTEPLTERSLQRLLDLALRHAAEDFVDDAQVQNVLVVLAPYLARSQLDGNRLDHNQPWERSAAGSYWSSWIRQLRHAQQSLALREDLAPSGARHWQDQLQGWLSRVRQMRQATSLSEPSRAGWSDPLEFPHPTVHLDWRRFHQLRRLHVALRKCGKESRLIAVLDHHLSLTDDPDRYTFATAKACVQWWSGQRQPAIGMLERLCRERPDDTDLRFLLAGAYYHAGQLREALVQTERLRGARAVVTGNLARLRDQIVAQWDTLAKLRDLEGHAGVVHSLAFSPDGSLLASASVDRTVRLWDVASSRLVSVLTGHSDMVLCVAFSPDGGQLASSGYDRQVRLWDVARGTVRAVLQGHEDVVRTVAFSRDGLRLASAGDDGVIRTWDVRRGQPAGRLRARGARILSVAFSADGGVLAAAGSDGAIRLWDVRRSRLRTTLHGHTGPVTSVVFSSPSATRGQGELVSAGEDGRIVRWDCSTGAARLTIETSSAIRSLALSPDGRSMVTGCHDGSVKLWDVGRGTVRFRFRDQARAVQPVVAYCPDGRLIASAGYDGTAHLWRADTEALQPPPSSAPNDGGAGQGGP